MTEYGKPSSENRDADAEKECKPSMMRISAKSSERKRRKTSKRRKGEEWRMNAPKQQPATNGILENRKTPECEKDRQLHTTYIGGTNRQISSHKCQNRNFITEYNGSQQLRKEKLIATKNYSVQLQDQYHDPSLKCQMFWQI